MLSPGRRSAKPKLQVTDAVSPAASNDSAARRARSDFCVLGGGFAARALEQNCEFLAAKAADDRAFILQFVADDAKNLIADIMPVGVVDALEMIDVEHDRGERAVPTHNGRALSKKARRLKTPVKGSMFASSMSSFCRRSSRSAERSRAYSSSPTGGFLMNSSAPLSSALMRCCWSELDDIKMM